MAPVSMADIKYLRTLVDELLPALASGLLDGGVYAFQVRVGNGKTWSEWSHTSSPFLFQVPPPIPPTAASLKAQKTVTVEVMSATAARVVWGDFKPAPGLTLLEYEVRATPRQEGNPRAKAFPSQALTFQHRYRGGFIEHELLNLLPFTTYTFSVQDGERRREGEKEGDWPKGAVRLSAKGPVSEGPVVAGGPGRAQVFVVTTGGGGLLPGPADDAMEHSPFARAFEEEGVQYDLEYAFVLGDDLDTAEMRVANSLWRSPREVTMLGSRGVTPHYRVLLPELRPFRGDPLKLALLQRVRFRLRARLPPEGSSSRWWSSVSPPVSTGFAGAENVTGSLVASASGLSVEVRFQLDTRLAGIGSQKELQLQRAELFQVLDSESRSDRSKELGSTDAGTAAAGSAIQPMTWPRGFGHPYATRYQLRKRHWLPLQSAWSGWEAFGDAALPKELPGGSGRVQGLCAGPGGNGPGDCSKLVSSEKATSFENNDKLHTDNHQEQPAELHGKQSAKLGNKSSEPGCKTTYNEQATWIGERNALSTATKAGKDGHRAEPTRADRCSYVAYDGIESRKGKSHLATGSFFSQEKEPESARTSSEVEPGYDEGNRASSDHNTESTKKLFDYAWRPVNGEKLLGFMGSVACKKRGWFPYENGHALVSHRAKALRSPAPVYRVKDYPYRVSVIRRKGTWWIVERAHDMRLDKDNKTCFLQEEAEVPVSLFLPETLIRLNVFLSSRLSLSISCLCTSWIPRMEVGVSAGRQLE
eukprot:s6319_g1.t1